MAVGWGGGTEAIWSVEEHGVMYTPPAPILDPRTTTTNGRTFGSLLVNRVLFKMTLAVSQLGRSQLDHRLRFDNHGQSLSPQASARFRRGGSDE